MVRPRGHVGFARKRCGRPHCTLLCFFSQTHIALRERTHTYTHTHTQSRVTDLLFSGFTLWRFNLLVSGLSVHFWVQITLFLFSQDTRVLRYQRPGCRYSRTYLELLVVQIDNSNIKCLTSKKDKQLICDGQYWLICSHYIPQKS